MECSVLGCARPGAVEAVVRLSKGGPAPWEVHEILAHLCRAHATAEPFDPRHLRLGTPFLSYRGAPATPRKRKL